MLKLRPDEFRSMSMGEFSLALDGHLMTVGIKKSDLTWNDVLEQEALNSGKIQSRRTDR